VPPLPLVPEGWDRWVYVGRGFEGEVNSAPYAHCFSHDRVWAIAFDGHNPLGMPNTHYIFAVKDEPARDCLFRLWHHARKLAAQLSPKDADLWNTLDEAEQVLNGDESMAARAWEWAHMTDAEMRLRGGEMTAQEIRTVRAVLKHITGYHH
jgi:hypothetical protein